MNLGEIGPTCPQCGRELGHGAPSCAETLMLRESADASPIKDSLDAIQKRPRDEFRGGFVAQEGGDMGAIIEGRHDFGKPGGWEMGGEASWLKRAGWKIAALVMWKK